MTAVSVVTGAAGAMGSACALAIAPEADVVVLTDLDGDRLAVVAERVERETATKVRTMVGDLGEPRFIADLAARADALGALRALVHTAGLSPSMASWKEILRVDLIAVALLLTGFGPNVRPGSVPISRVASWR